MADCFNWLVLWSSQVQVHAVSRSIFATFSISKWSNEWNTYIIFLDDGVVLDRLLSILDDKGACVCSLQRRRMYSNNIIILLFLGHFKHVWSFWRHVEHIFIFHVCWLSLDSGSSVVRTSVDAAVWRLLQNYSIVHVVNKVVVFTKDNTESKLGSPSILGFHSNPSVERLDNVLRDNKP